MKIELRLIDWKKVIGHLMLSPLYVLGLLAVCFMVVVLFELAMLKWKIVLGIFSYLFVVAWVAIGCCLAFGRR